MELYEVSDEDLVRDAVRFMGEQRKLTAGLVLCLAEIEERRLHLLAGFSSMFDFCQQKLGMSEGEAFRRILAARMGRRFPVVISLLASGRVHLSTLELVREWLTQENHDELLAAVAGKSKREVQMLLAARFPRPDRPSRIDLRATIEPLSEARFRVEFTASEALRQKLELCRELMSHANPSQDLAVVVERAVDLLLGDLERKRLGRVRRQQPQRERPQRPKRPKWSEVRENNAMRSRVQSSRVATAVRREVFERDGLRCTFVAEGGRRCNARALLELDHVQPKALGGADDASNLRVRCRAHNQLWAEQVFGRAKVEDHRRLRQEERASERATEMGDRNFRQQKRTSGQAAESRHEDFCQQKCRRGREREAPGRPTEILDNVHFALRAMGFREGEARRAVAEVEKRHGVSEALALEQTLREALHVATAA